MKDLHVGRKATLVFFFLILAYGHHLAVTWQWVGHTSTRVVLHRNFD